MRYNREPKSCSNILFRRNVRLCTAHDAATMRETSDSSREKKPLCGPRLQIIRRNVIRCQDRLRECVANLLTLEYTLYVQRHYLFFFFSNGKIDSDVKSQFLQIAFVAHFLAYFFLFLSTILFSDIFISNINSYFLSYREIISKVTIIPNNFYFYLASYSIFMFERENTLIALKHLYIGAERINSSNFACQRHRTSL